MKIENARHLDAAIKNLEEKKTIQEGMLADQFHATVDHFRPANLVKSAIHNFTEKHDTAGTVIKAAGGIGAGILAKKLLLGKTTSIIGRIAATALKTGAVNTVVHNSDKIGAWGTAIYNNLFRTKDHHNNGSKQ